MATTRQTLMLPAAPQAGRHLPDAQALQKFFAAFGESVSVWQTYCRLNRLRADQLAELGIRREEIGRAAMFGNRRD